MNKSIRARITIIFIAITALLIGTLFLVNRFLLLQYYMNEKVKTLETAYVRLNELVDRSIESGEGLDIFVPGEKGEQDSEEAGLLRDFNEGSNIDFVIWDKETNTGVGASREKEWMFLKLQAYIDFEGVFDNGMVPDSMYRQIKKSDNYTIQVTFDRRSGNNNLECWGTFPGTQISFLMNMPVESINESISVMNKFILIVGLILLVIGSVIIYIATGLITKPINHLASISEKMSNLDFSEKYEGKNEDEIGVLGKSMNIMSEKLEKTIEDLQTANVKLQEDIDLKEKIDEMRKDFISSVSHELKTPIALIEGYAEGLTEGVAEEPEMRDYYCNVIMDEAGKMNKMVRQLTSLTQYEFGEAQLCMEDFDLGELLTNVLERDKMRLEEKEAVLIREYPEHISVHADEFKIEEVFTNYLNNALNHLDGKRRIIVKVEKEEISRVRLSVYNDGEQIPAESLERVWEKFYKVDKARTREYGGSGIGLSIVKAIAEAHGQKYGVRNVSEGVEFYITLDCIG